MNRTIRVELDEQSLKEAMRPIVRTPLLSWAAASWERLDPESVLIVCPEGALEQVLECVPERLSCTVCLADAADPAKEDIILDSAAVWMPEAACAENGFVTEETAGSWAALKRLLIAERLDVLRRSGVEIWDESNCYVGPFVTAGAGTELLPGCILYGETAIGEGCVIGPNTILENTRIGDRTTVNSSQLYSAEAGSDTNIGPFTYVRPGTRIGDRVKAGDFVELKNSSIGNGTKISHLTYIGDSDVGERVNFGCGTVVCNYDGTKKYRTTIGNDAFIGCNTNLVAPVTVEDGGYTAAGTTVRKTVPSGALSYTDGHQKVIEGWAEKKLGRKK